MNVNGENSKPENLENSPSENHENSNTQSDQSIIYIISWKSLVNQFTNDSTFHNGNILNGIIIKYEEIIKSIFSCKYDKNFEKEKNVIPCDIIFKIWNKMYYASDQYKYQFTLQGLSKSQKDLIQKQKSNQRAYITSLTDHIITAFRKELVIDDRFIFKAFEHDLESILSFIFDNTEFFIIKISTNNLTDLYLTFAIDMSHIKIFSKMLHHVNIQHLEYALRFATLDFLMIIWKIRRWIPNYDEYMQTLQSIMSKRDWKQLQYFDWWERHKPVIVSTSTSTPH
jgi:hypothetical protein